MKKKLLRIISILLAVAICCGILAGCALFNFVEYDPGEGYDEEVVEENTDFVVSCSLTETIIELHNIGYYGDKGKLVYAKPYEYIAGETEAGICENKNVAPTVVANYACGTEATITINRFTAADPTDPNYYDTSYCKFFVLNDSNQILMGPIYPTSIESELNHEEVVQVEGKKGIFADNIDEEIVNLGAQHTEIDMLATGMIVPLEYVTKDEKGNVTEIIPIEYEEHLDGDGVGYIIAKNVPTSYKTRQYVQAYWHNGTKYYFRTTSWKNYGVSLTVYDAQLAKYTRFHTKVTVILLLQWVGDQYVQPYFLTYNTARADANYCAINASNKYGAEYWAAYMEFMAYRYSHEETWEDAEYGTVETWVMGNEIDQSDSWNSLVDPRYQEMLDVDDYTIEQERMLRITNTSFKHVHQRVQPLVSFTQWWNASGGIYDYHPKDIFDYLSAKTKREGNYEWGIVAHPHGYCSGHIGFWTNDINSGVTGALNTPRITWTNLEVLQLYLEQPTKLCFGKVRDVYVTEGGISSGQYDSARYSQEEQAAGVAYAYYKVTQIDCIKAMNYYRLKDHWLEITWGDYVFGLWDTSNRHKLAYDVYKYIDTQYSFQVSGQYLKYITWIKTENGNRIYMGTQYNNVASYHDTMQLVVSLFDWENTWDESKIIVRYIDEAQAPSI